MPRRSNPFQQLVLLLNEQLQEDAEVLESAILTDGLTGYETEVDVLVTKEVGGIPVVLGIECTAEKRPSTVEWVREMIAKHENLPVDKTILVSRSGYTAQADALARAKNVLPLTFEEAETGDWATFVGGLSGLRIAFAELTVDQFHLSARGGDKGGGLDIDAGLRQSDREELCRVEEYLEAMVGRGDLLEQVFRKWLSYAPDERPSELTFRVDSTPTVLTEVQARDGSWNEVVSSAADVRAKIVQTPLDLVAQRYLGHQVAHAVVPNVFQKGVGGPEEIVVNLVGDDQGLRKAGVLVPASGGEEARYQAMTFPSSSDDEVGRTAADATQEGTQSDQGGNAG